MRLRSTIHALAAALLCLALAACGGTGPGGGGSGNTATVLVSLGGPLAKLTGDPADLAAIASVTLTVTARDMATITAAVPLGGQTLTLAVPAGANRTFSASAKDAGDAVTHSGSTVVAMLAAGTRVRVNLVLNPTGPDTTPPTVQATSPTGGASGVAVNGTVSATFSEAMDAATIGSSSFQLRYPDPFGTGGATLAVGGSVSYNATGHVATFTPSSALPASTQFTATIAGTVADVAGNLLGTPHAWTFTTGASADTTPPTVTASTPVDLATEVDPATAITVTFSEAMDPATLTGAMTMTGPGGAVSGTVSYGGTTATFLPGAVVYGATYTVTVSTAATDLAGNPLAAPFSYTFTILAPPTFAGLTLAVPSGPATVDVAWAAATDDVSTTAQIVYDIHVATTPGTAFAADVTTAPGATRHTVSGLVSGTDYYLTVRARDAAGNSDANTVEARVTPTVTTTASGIVYDLMGRPASGLSNRVYFSYADNTCGTFTVDFGDGATDVRNCPRDGGTVMLDHAYLAPGTYTVTLSEPTSDVGLVQSMVLTVATVHRSQTPSRVLAGGASTLVIRDDSRALAWGTNNGGALGTGMTTYSPLLVQAVTDLVSLDGKAWYSVGLIYDGTVWGWGWGPNIGLPTLDNPVPQALAGMAGVIAISSGYAHTLALADDGTVFGFGGEANNVIGPPIGDSVARQIPGLSAIIAVAAGEQHSLALQADGTVLAWGNNTHGELGDGTTNAHTDPAPVSGLTQVVAIAAGSWHSVALKADGTVWAWGYNGNGQLGDGTWNNQPTPVQVLTGVAAFATGNNHTLALLTDGTVMAWGYNAYGQVGNGTFTDQGAPVAVTGLAGVAEVDGGEFHSAARLTDGTIWTWGRNDSGQLGDGTTTDNPLAAPGPGLNVNP